MYCGIKGLSYVLKQVESSRISAFRGARVKENGNIEEVAERYESYNASIVRVRGQDVRIMDKAMPKTTYYQI